MVARSTDDRIGADTLPSSQAGSRSAAPTCACLNPRRRRSAADARLLDSYDGKQIVGRSIDLGEPVVYVSMNYRSVPPAPPISGSEC